MNLSECVIFNHPDAGIYAGSIFRVYAIRDLTLYKVARDWDNKD